MPLFERSQTTTALVNYLRPFDKGSTISYSDLTGAAGEPIASDSHKLKYARFILERDHNQVWITVKPNVGVQRLNDREMADRLQSWWLSGARRKLGRGGDQSQMVLTEELDIDEQARFSVNCIQRELAMQTLSKAAARHLEKVARGTSNDLPSFNILEWAISLTPRKSA